MLLDKAALSYRFHMRDSEGRSLPRLRSEECASLEFNFLKAVTEAIIHGEIPSTPWNGPQFPEGLTSAFRTITSNEIRGGERTYDDMRNLGWGLTPDQSGALFGDDDVEASEFFRTTVTVLAGCHMLCVLVPGNPGDECIIKINSDLSQAWPGKPWRRIAKFLGWAMWEFRIVLAAGDSRSYHCEVWVPPSVEIDLHSPELTPIPPIPHVGYLGKNCFHLAASNFRSQRYLLHLNLRAKISGWLSATLATCLSVLALLLVGLEKSGDLAEAKASAANSAPAVNLTVLLTTIFLGVGAAAVTILAKSSSGKHALDDKMLRGLRGVSWVIVAVSFSAVMILFCANTENSMQNGFWVLLLIQCSILLVTVIPVLIRIVTVVTRAVKSIRRGNTPRQGLAQVE
ncbi:hypothetical protein [Streptomyces canus]|uniref:hypothetical protein n=1 Tax=Streptomyces canus TaxID=58343 RepID=UPI0030DDE163